MITEKALSRILRTNYLHGYSKKECDQIAGLMIKDDFPKNGITLWSQALKFLDYVQKIRVEKIG